jgi:hypothetical protein
MGERVAQRENAAGVTQILSAGFKSNVSGTIRLVGGIHTFAPVTFVTTASISVLGNPTLSSVLRLPAGSICSGGFFRWVNAHHVTIKDLTIDLNGAIAPTRICPVINVTGGSGFVIENVHIERAGAGRWILLSINGASDGKVLNSSFRASAIQTVQNQGLNISVSYGHVADWSFIGDTFANTGVALSGSDMKFCHNIVRGWGYGAGISVGKFTADHVEICDNVISDSGRQRDADGIFSNGIENWGTNTTIVNNIISNVAASGIYIGGKNALVCANIIQGSGKRADGNGAPGIQVGYASSAANGDGSVLIRNQVSDDGSGTTSVGFADMPRTRGVVLQGNDFSHVRIPTRIRGGSLQGGIGAGAHC